MYIEDNGYKGHALALVEDSGETYVVVRWFECEEGNARDFVTIELVENVEIAYGCHEKAAIIAEMLK